MAEINLGKVRQTDAELEEKIKAAAGGGVEALWKAPTPGSAPTEVELGRALDGYRFYSIIFAYSASLATTLVASGIIDAGGDGVCEALLVGKGHGRKAWTVSGDKKKITFGDTIYRTTLTSTSNNRANEWLVPYMVLGYK